MWRRTYGTERDGGEYAREQPCARRDWRKSRAAKAPPLLGASPRLFGLVVTLTFSTTSTVYLRWLAICPTFDIFIVNKACQIDCIIDESIIAIRDVEGGIKPLSATSRADAWRVQLPAARARLARPRTGASAAGSLTARSLRNDHAMVMRPAAAASGALAGRRKRSGARCRPGCSSSGSAARICRLSTARYTHALRLYDPRPATRETPARTSARALQDRADQSPGGRSASLGASRGSFNVRAAAEKNRRGRTLGFAPLTPPGPLA